MLFHTFDFVFIFLPLAIASYFLVSGHKKLRQWVLIVASAIFYSWWDIRFLPLLIGQICLTWILVNISFSSKKKYPLYIGVILNLSSIGLWKYLDFIVEIFNTTFNTELPKNNLLLPIGISFFSFQLISYLIDFSKSEAPIYPFRSFALFVMVFPHLIAGPIVRHNEIIPQFDNNPTMHGLNDRLFGGIGLFSIGFLKKVFIADELAKSSDTIFDLATPLPLNIGDAWTAAISFSLQLFLDFSAYTEMAIGIALILGLLLPENFNRPYVAKNLKEFWGRWHISLSKFIRDYLYIPLGGSRNGHLIFIIATLGAMTVCGLWHGAGWGFVIWGFYHGLGLLICRYWQYTNWKLPIGICWLITMLFVVVGWVIFRSNNFMQAISIIKSMFGFNELSGSIGNINYIVIAFLISILLPSAHNIIIFFQKNWRTSLALSITTIALGFSFAGKSVATNFIYFQF